MHIRSVKKGMRFAVLKRDNYSCQYCGRKAPDVELHVDHVIPIKWGGSNNIDNLAAACRACNSGKGSTLLDTSPMPIRRRHAAMKIKEDLIKYSKTPITQNDYKSICDAIDKLAFFAAPDQLEFAIQIWYGVYGDESPNGDRNGYEWLAYCITLKHVCLYKAHMAGNKVKEFISQVLSVVDKGGLIHGILGLDDVTNEAIQWQESGNDLCKIYEFLLKKVNDKDIFDLYDFSIDMASFRDLGLYKVVK